MDLIVGLDRSRFNPALTVPGNGPLVEWAARANVPHTIVPNQGWAGRIELARVATKLFGAILRHRSRIVHAAAPMAYRAAGVAAWLAGSARVCHLGYPPEEGELARSFTVEPHVIIACHEGQAGEVAPEVRSLTRKARLISVPNGIDVTRFRPPEDGEQAPSWHPGKPVVAILGHLSEVKGYPTFLRAAAQIVAAGGDCAFVAIGKELAGDGYRAVLDRMIADLGLTDRVTFLGFRSDAETVLRAVDVVVMPSQSEGLPLALLEAMACGRPIVATPVGGIPEAIADRVNGLLVPQNDAGAIAQAVLSVLRDRSLAVRLGQQARADAVSRYSVNRALSAIESTYEALLSPSADRPGTVAASCRDVFNQPASPADG
jgi:glycosyltransferase involved in cell wall biosynthesis